MNTQVTCHEVPREARFAHVKPRQVYQQVLLKVHNSVSDERERDEMLGYFVTGWLRITAQRLQGMH
ncbi:hypothetical protein COOONC_03983 [Cooperia oncophora]